MSYRTEASRITTVDQTREVSPAMVTARGSLQLTLALFKPDITRVPHVLKAIRQRIVEEEFFIIRNKELRLTREETEQFYIEHQGKFFYNRLVTFMSSGPTQALILAHEDAIKRWRHLMGPTKVYKTKFEAPSTIRGMYGLTDTRNSTHGSDSPDTAAKEIAFFYPEFSIEDWYKNDEPSFRLGKVSLDDVNFVHRLQ
ncbi:Nucleoside diphosphate kinase 6 [Halocaridina rubra]|uniref:Nucleoside diphosphate kinase n=1 Tax=Halocaridina rubra TaxID=373956 RepID=A0AAN8WRR0_HALRR